jgi:phage terminase large subunit-like protein
MVQRDDAGGFHAWCNLWVPEPDRPVDVTDVMQHIRTVSKDYAVHAVSYDPRFFDVAATMLFDEGIPMVEVPQSLERMTVICGALLEAVKRSEIHHDADPAFSAHVLNAVARNNEHGFTLSKGKSRGHIDAVVALALAMDRAREGGGEHTYFSAITPVWPVLGDDDDE